MLYFAIIVIAVVLDQATKYWIVTSMELYQSNVIIPGFFNLVYVTNRGAAFSMFAEVDSPWRHYFFVSIGCFALIALTLLWFRQRKEGFLICMALGLIAGGALGNLIDRIRLGAVVDFIDVYIGSHHWPAFNVADSAICIGVFFFLLTGFLEDKKTKL